MVVATAILAVGGALEIPSLYGLGFVDGDAGELVVPVVDGLLSRLDDLFFLCGRTSRRCTESTFAVA